MNRDQADREVQRLARRILRVSTCEPDACGLTPEGRLEWPVKPCPMRAGHDGPHSSHGLRAHTPIVWEDGRR